MEVTTEEKLYKIFNNVNDWLKFAEAKNFGLLTLNAAVVFGISQTTFEQGSVIKIVALYVFTPLAIISSFFSLLSLFPILSQIEKGSVLKGFLSKVSNLIDKEKPFENIHFYGYLRTLEKKKFIDEFKTKTDIKQEFTKFEEELVVQILYNSRITWLKYQLFKIAGFACLLGVILSPIALLVIKIMM